MSILLLNRDEGIKLSEMLKEVKKDLVVLSMYELEDSEEFKYFEIIKDMWNPTGFLELRALELNEKYKFKKIIAEDEFDLVRSAQLREYFNIPGQSVDSSIAFRNKVKMKDCLRDVVKVPEYTLYKSMSSLYDFIKKNGYPVVVKPTDKAGAQGVSIIRNKEDLYEFANQKIEGEYEIETFINGSMYHIDAIVENNNINMFMVSKYINNCLSFFRNSEALGSYQIDKDNQIYLDLKEYLKKILNVLPKQDISAYHLEVFHNEEDGFVFCEIASRLGGAYIFDEISHRYDVDILTYIYRKWANLEVKNIEEVDNNKLSGFLFIPPKEGVLLSIPDRIDFDWVCKFQMNGKVGENYSKPGYFQNKIAGFMVEGNTSKEIQERMVTLQNWCDKNIIWEINEKIN